jgi:hypothetical protein
MTVPGFHSEASVYKSTGLYRGYGESTGIAGVSRLIPASTACEIACGVADAACLAGCSFSGPFAPLCWAGCTVATVACLAACQDGGGGGGGGGGPPPCCPADRPHCCGSCVPLPGGGSKCDDACINPLAGQHCP